MRGDSGHVAARAVRGYGDSYLSKVWHFIVADAGNRPYLKTGPGSAYATSGSSNGAPMPPRIPIAPHYLAACSTRVRTQRQIEDWLSDHPATPPAASVPLDERRLCQSCQATTAQFIWVRRPVPPGEWAGAVLEGLLLFDGLAEPAPYLGIGLLAPAGP